MATLFINTSDNGGMEQRNYKAVDLSNGTSAAVSSTTLELLTCQTAPIAAVSQILLEAADPVTLDTTYNVVKAKKRRIRGARHHQRCARQPCGQYGIYPDASQQCKSG